MPERVIRNPAPAAFARDFDRESVLAFHRKLPGYVQTPLVAAPGIAAQLGVRHVWVKDESCRMGLPAYKILGASWAVYRGLEERSGRFAAWATLDELAQQLRGRGPLELVTASEGNHGRALARVARWLGFRAHILLPASADLARVEHIRLEGARITIVDGSYDEAVNAAARLDGATSLVISDTAWEGYEKVPRWVVEGYSTLFTEVDSQLASDGLAQPDVVAVQMGVGSLGAAVVRHYRQPGFNARVIGVEPERAACVFESVRAGRLVDVQGPFDPAMGGLNCGRASLGAWPYLQKGLSACVIVPTVRAEEAMQLLAREGVASSPCGAAGLAGLLEHGPALDLRKSDSVLVISTEGPAAAAEV